MQKANLRAAFGVASAIVFVMAGASSPAHAVKKHRGHSRQTQVCEPSSSSDSKTSDQAGTAAPSCAPKQEPGVAMPGVAPSPQPNTRIIEDDRAHYAA